jgi:hypothetical protein
VGPRRLLPDRSAPEAIARAGGAVASGDRPLRY